MKPVITFANWGNYTVAFQSLFENLGMEVIRPEKTTSQTVTDGAKIAPDMFCFPLKVNLGNYLSAIKKGANVIFMATASGGSCRLRYYGVVQDKVLREAGHNIDFVIFDQSVKDAYLKIKNISGASFLRIIKAGIFFLDKLRFIEKLEKQAQYIRPREIKKGKIDALFFDFLSKTENYKSGKDFSRLKKETLRKFAGTEIDKNRRLPKVGIIGEIYTVCDPMVNFEVEKKLGNEGIEIHREMDLSYQLTKKLVFKDFFIQRKIQSYLKSTVGGHGRDAIYETLNYIKKGFDGIIHLLPAFCMPEVTVRPILEKLHQESGIPFLSISIDEQTAEAGMNTRLEAFVDVVENYYRNKNPK